MNQKRLPRPNGEERNTPERELDLLNRIEPGLEALIERGHTDVGAEISFWSPTLAKERTFFGTLQMKLDQLRYHREMVTTRIEAMREPLPNHLLTPAA